MSLQLKGKIMAVMPIETGEGKNNQQWKKRLFVIEYPDGNFTKTLALTVWGERADTLHEHMTGREVTVSFNAESRQYNNKWYTDLKAWKIEQSTEDGDNTEPASTNTGTGEQSDLPF